jgi:hypothetical protein
MSQTGTIERTAVVAYTLLQELHRVLADPGAPDEVTLGIILGTAMFCDEKVGPIRAEKLLREAPGVVLKSDAYVTDEAMVRAIPALKAFSRYLSRLEPVRQRPEGKPAVSMA